MVESPVKKESLAATIIISGLVKSEHPCVLFSGGKNSLVVLHMMKELPAGKLTVLYLDTGSEFPEVRSYIQKMKKIWKFNLAIIKREELTGESAEKISCACESWKKAVLPGILSKNTYDGIFIGENLESGHSLSDELKKNPELAPLIVLPIASFTCEDVWDYIRIHNIPYCSLYSKGYLKIDCMRCTHGDPTPRENSLKEEDEKIMRERMKKLGYL
jgi:phosphoadenosine phosphosulfate reductase